ncbi:MAG: hypothetical protein JSW43_03505 [Gemmatimonadota bacterium]|nr:MAG: hypothetical protein JSW43_03505 [Gemmatimonadota bacterium]
MEAWELANILIPLAGMATGVVVIVTLGRTVRHWVDTHYGRRGLPGSDELRQEMARLEDRVGTLEGVAGRVEELEERLDFAERVLTQRSDRDRLAPGA